MQVGGRKYLSMKILNLDIDVEDVFLKTTFRMFPQ